MKIRYVLVIMMFLLIINSVACTSQKDTNVLPENGEVLSIESPKDDQIDAATVLDVNTNNTAIAENEFDEIITVNINGDFVAEKILDAYENSELAVIAKYSKDLEIYAADVSGFPITSSEFIITEILKGESDEQNVTVNYMGGTVSVYEAMQKLSKDTIIKRGYDQYTEEEAKKIGLTICFDEKAERYSTDKEYLLLLNYDENGEISDSLFRVVVIEDEMIYDEVTESYIKLSEFDN